MVQRLAAYVYLAAVALVVTLQRGVFARAVTHHGHAGDSSLLRKLIAGVAGGLVVIIFLLRENWKEKTSSRENAGRAVARVSPFDNLKWLYISGGDGLGRHPIAAILVSLPIFGIPTALFFLTHPGVSRALMLEGGRSLERWNYLDCWC